MEGWIWLCLMLAVVCDRSLHKVPLTYAYSPDFSRTYPIVLSFNETETITPFGTNILYLYNLNLTLQTRKQARVAGDEGSVVIGLKYPSDFLFAIQSTYKIPPHQIQFAKMQYLELRINDNSFVESADYFVNKEDFSVRVFYNYGDQMILTHQTCSLVDSDQIYFDEILIRQILNSMDKKNKITYTFIQKQSRIQVEGNIQNFPQITLMLGDSLFRLKINPSTLFYIPRGEDQVQSSNIIGYHVLTQFSKFEMDHEKIIFKRTSEFYQLYLFLAYFFIAVTLTLYFIKDNLFETMRFVKNLIKWAAFENPQSRIQVLRTQLQ